MTLRYSRTKYIIYILFTVVYFAQKQSISTHILGNILATVVYFAELVKTGLWAIWLQQHALYTWFLCTQARKVFFSQLKIITIFDLKITSQNIVRKEHEQVYYAFLILLAPPDLQTFRRPCTLKCFKRFIKILVKHVTLTECVLLGMPFRIHQS